MTSPIIISIEANIGAGKSTVIQNLIEQLDTKYAICIPEPIHEWEHFRDPETNISLLELYYMNPTKYAFPIQTMIYNSFENSIRTTPYSPLVITERSQKSSSGIFAKMLHDSGILSPIEYQVYKTCIANNPMPLDVCIYLRTEPEVCYERIRHRNREGEQHISLEYLRTCHVAHELWITKLAPHTHLKIIDVGTKTADKITAEILEILEDLSHI